ncbi:hypothetical protein H9Q10_02450 [Eikenella sp. S3360]|uniref:Uncharacterized protein n=1 Tax=Eikenella glucosivorans TaxID=2766967 RepID=A0ABS0N8A2_9NEIS|nr:hypothetical protein [Eikenella glucosivorans]MBH5328534.1 hypothetical protein [Eikenella glucosivorans]
MSPKAKKILIGAAIAIAFLGWRGYAATKSLALQDFVKNYNIFINNENRFVSHLNERDDFGAVPEAVMMPVRHTAGFMATSDSGCQRIPDAALAAECSSAFSDYHSILQEVEKQGLDESRLKQVIERGERTHRIINQVAAKFPNQVEVQN